MQPQTLTVDLEDLGRSLTPPPVVLRAALQSLVVVHSGRVKGESQRQLILATLECLCLRRCLSRVVPLQDGRMGGTGVKN